MQHLDLALADGSSAADVLGAHRTVVREWRVQGPDTLEADLEGWRLINMVSGASESGAGALLRVAEHDEAAGRTHCLFRYEVGIDAARVTTIELDLRAFVASSSGLHWMPGAGRLDHPGRTPFLEQPVRGGDSVKTVSFSVGGRPDWRGTVPWLRLTPIARGPQSFELHAIRFVHEGFSAGTVPQPRPGGEHGQPAQRVGRDGGMLGYEGNLRRTWPGDLDVAQFAYASVPRGGSVVVRAALPVMAQEEAITVAIDVRERGADSASGGAWERVAENEVPRAEPFSGWRFVRGSLYSFEGKDIELRFLAWEDDEPAWDDAARPRQARVWWSVPQVLGEQPEGRRPDVVLVTLDTTRADALGCYGGAGPTPNLDVLAESGILYEDAVAACNSTLPSHTSILTGFDVPSHGVLDNRSVLSARISTLGQEFRDAGYYTAAAVSVGHLQSGYSGLGRGFDQFLDLQMGAMIDGGITLDRVERWLEQWKVEGDRPAFLWVHLFDPHTPYKHPKGFLEEFAAREELEVPSKLAAPGAPRITDPTFTGKGGFLEGVSSVEYANFLYRAGVAYTDDLFGRLSTALEEAGMGDALMVLTADHGESLGELDVWYNHAYLHPPVIRVPLIVRLPDGPRGLRVPGRAAGTDIAGSLMQYLALPPIGSPEAADLFAPEILSGAGGGPLAGRRVFFAHSGVDQIGLRDDVGHFFVNADRPYRHLGRERETPAGMTWLFDPADQELGAEEGAALRAAAAGTVELWRSTRRRAETVRRELSADERETLEALGYGGHLEEQPGGETREDAAGGSSDE